MKMTSYLWKSIGLLFIFFLFASCANIKDDLLSSNYSFTNSCDNPANPICTNYYPEDGESFPCASDETESSSKCSATNSIGVCQRIPLILEIVYYNTPWTVATARTNCNAIGQSRFSTEYFDP